MDEKRGKMPSAIGRFDARRIKLIYCDCTFLSFLDYLLEFVITAMICLSHI